MKRIVIDTNIFVSAVLGGTLKVVLDYWREKRFTLLVTDEIVREYLEVLRRPKFGLPGSVVDNIIAYIFHRAEFVTPIERLHIVEADPQDNKFLEAAIAGNADEIISGDGHLLNLRTFKHIPIITAHEFIESLKNQLPE